MVMNTHAETLEKIYNMLQEDTIQIPKSLMAYDDIDENTKIMFSVVLDEGIKNKWNKERFIAELRNLTQERIAIECVCSKTKAKLIYLELLELIPDIDDILYLNQTQHKE